MVNLLLSGLFEFIGLFFNVIGKIKLMILVVFFFYFVIFLCLCLYFLLIES